MAGGCEKKATFKPGLLCHGCRNVRYADDADAHQPGNRHGHHGELPDGRNWGHACDLNHGSGSCDRWCMNRGFPD